MKEQEPSVKRSGASQFLSYFLFLKKKTYETINKNRLFFCCRCGEDRNNVLKKTHTHTHSGGIPKGTESVRAAEGQDRMCAGSNRRRRTA